MGHSLSLFGRVIQIETFTSSKLAELANVSIITLVRETK